MPRPHRPCLRNFLSSASLGTRAPTRYASTHVQSLPYDQTELRSRALVRCDRPAWRRELRGGGLSRLSRRGGGRWGAGLDDVGFPAQPQGRERAAAQAQAGQQYARRQARRLFLALQLRGTALPDPAYGVGGGRRAEGRQDA